MPAEASYINNGRAAAVATPRERGGGAVPGTPSRKDRMRESSAVQDPGLKDYRLGECLGKGAFGSVYKAFNWGTGEAVAIKQIKLTDLPKSELRMIESEIDLLKNLFHDNIVKYIGFVKTAECLNIILEYCENGSLYSICKAYGKFPENLVGVYMTQVLQGLQYLHDQGVIHRDIKGANILTTKDGTVKLADFGVSTSTLAGGPQDKDRERNKDREAQVVGTPYWMAPEIIQLSGASSASDIWSVGCTVIELLQGKPPYHNLAAMPALFAIVNDDHPPLPEGISAAARDFLMQCFQKDPNLRVTARKLLKHAWIVGCRRTDAPVSKSKPRAPANFSEAVEEVKQWNKALNSTSSASSSAAALRTSIGSDTTTTTTTGTSSSRFLNGVPSKGPLFVSKHRRTADVFNNNKRPRQAGLVKPSGTQQDIQMQMNSQMQMQMQHHHLYGLLEDDDNWDDDFASAISPSALQLPHLRPHDNFGGLLSSDRLKAFASVNDLRSDNNNYDDDFEGEMLTIKGPNIRQFPETTTTNTQPEVLSTVQTIRPHHMQQTRGQRRVQAQAQQHKFSASTPNLQLQPGLLHRSKSTIERPTADGAFAAATSLASTFAPTRPKSPAKSKLSHRFTLPPQPSSVSVLYQEQASDDDDYSDLLAGNDDDDTIFFEQKLVQGAKQMRQHQQQQQQQQQQQVDGPRLFHPSDLTSLPRSMQMQSMQIQSAADVVAGGGAVVKKKPIARPGGAIPDKPMRRARSSIEIQKFAEDDDEDFSDVFGPETGSIAAEREDASERGSAEDAGLMLMSKMSGNSWLGDDDDEDDPFASMDPGWDEMDMDAQVARDRHARLARRVEELVGSLKTTQGEGGEDMLADLSADLLVLLWENPEAKNLVISAHGLLPLLEILEPCTVKSKHHMILQLLKVVNTIILDDVEIQENLCFVGGIPIITKFAARQYSDDIRLEAAAFVRQMYQTSTLTLQMFVSAGGLNVLVEFLDEDYDSARDLVLIGVNGIWNVFELQGPTPKNDFCRIFSRSKILYPLALVLHRVLDDDDHLDDDDELGELVQGRIVNIFYLFSQAENYVKEVVADRQVLKSVLKDLRRMTPVHQITMLKFIKNLSMLSTTIESLHSADAIEFLIDLLSFSMKKDQKHLREISNQVLNTLFNLCRLSKERQEDAAVGGIIPLLLRIMKTDRPPKEFALPILCDMAHSGSKGRRYLWQNKGLDFYVSLLSDQYWQVTALDAILVWLQEETANVESHLMHENHFTRAITSCFGTNRLNAFDFNLLEPLLKLLRLSPGLTASLAKPEMFAGIAQRLGHKKAVVRLNLLRLVRIIVDSCSGDASLLGGGDGSRTLNHAQVRSLMEAIQLLAEADSAVLVRNLAAELVKSHPSSSSNKMAMKSSISISATAQSSSSSRRNTSYTPPKMQQQQQQQASTTPTPSVPQTPTHASKASVTSLASVTSTGSNYIPIEVAASPRPRHFFPDHRERERERDRDRERDISAYSSSLYHRPQSRDGPTGIPRRVSEDTCSLSLVSSVGSGGSGSGSGSGSGTGSSGTSSGGGLVYSAKSRLPRTSVGNLPLGGPRRNPTPPMLVRGDVNVGFKDGGVRPSSSRGISMRESSVNVLSGLRRSHSRHIGEKRTQAR